MNIVYFLVLKKHSFGHTEAYCFESPFTKFVHSTYACCSLVGYSIAKHENLSRNALRKCP
jgi:hypothetical protein